MLVYQFRSHFAKNHAIAAATFIAFTLFYWYFDHRGGFYRNPSFTSTNPIWIYLPTIEGSAYAIMIAWYDNSFALAVTGFSKFVGRMGDYSYSIYLLHGLFIFRAALFVDAHIMRLSNFYIACLWALLFYLMMYVPGYLSYRFIESSFLKLRKRYIKQAQQIPTLPVGEPKPVRAEV
jgi:peptidoglycan/LPS O-acetylase OafA/YrhL